MDRWILWLFYGLSFLDSISMLHWTVFTTAICIADVIMEMYHFLLVYFVYMLFYHLCTEHMNTYLLIVDHLHNIILNKIMIFFFGKKMFWHPYFYRTLDIGMIYILINIFFDVFHPILCCWGPRSLLKNHINISMFWIVEHQTSELYFEF